MKRQINESEYLQVVGLLALAGTALSKMEDIEASLKDVLGATESDEQISGVGSSGHIGDAIYSRYSADMLLKKLGIMKAPQRKRRSGK